MNWTIKNGYIQYLHRGRMHETFFDLNKEHKSVGLVINCSLKPHEHGMRLHIQLRPESPIVLHKLLVNCEFPFQKTDTIFCNGYQSWTNSREFAINERLLPLRTIMFLIKMHRYGDINFYSYSGKPGEFHSHTYTYVRKNNEIFLAGSLSEKEGYTIFQYSTLHNTMNIIKDCEGLEVDRTISIIDVAFLEGDEQIIFDEYFKLGKLHARELPTTGWTSWYNYYTNISEEIILQNLRAFSKRKIGINIIQIDDGYQTAVGDWLSIKPNFPNGMKYIAKEIHNAGYLAGLWLAPFICEKKSTLFLHHKNWLVKDENNSPMVAGWNPLWSGNFYALDIYNDQARRYIEDVFNTVLRDWNFDMVKLDFLYAAAIAPQKGKSRGKIMHEAMEFLRNCVRGKKILGCGVPLGSAFGLVDYCRIGGDVALKWEDKLLKFVRYRERVDTKQSLLNTIHRRHLNGYAFLNDPDVFILRKENNSLSEDEKNTLFILNNIFGGLVFTSDNIENYSKEILQKYLSHLPLRSKTIENVQNEAGIYSIQFSIDSLSYFACANLSDESKNFSLPSGIFFFYDIITNTTQFVMGNSSFVLSPHQTKCALKLSSHAPSLAGSTGHIFPASEIEVFKIKGKNITIKKHPQALNQSTVYVRVPKKEKYFINGKESTAQEVHPEIFIITTTLE